MTASMPFLDEARRDAIERLHAATNLYTVEQVVRGLMARVAWPREGRRLLDPSCGDGAFLLVALDILLTAEPGISDDEIPSRMIGWEIHAGASRDARDRLGGALTQYGRSAAIADDLVVNRDFLTESRPTDRYDTVTGNPPYLRFCNVPKLLRREYEEALPPWSLLDLLHSFLETCTSLLTDRGEVAFVTADRWLFNANCADLRKALGRSMLLKHVSRLDQTTSFYRPKIRQGGTPPRIHPVEIVLTSIRSGHSGRAVGSDPIYPDTTDTLATERRLGDVADVRIAPWVGPLGVFVLEEAHAKQFGLEHLVPIVDTDDLAPNGTIHLPTRFAILTSPDREPPAEIAAHLRATRHLLPERAKQRKAWWLPPERIDSVDRSRTVLVVPRIARELRAHVVPAGTLPVNHNIMVVAAEPVRLERLRAIIASDATQRWICERASRLENGYFSFSTGLLRQLPIPDDLDIQI